MNQHTIPEIISPAEITLAEHAAVIRALGKRVVGDVIEIGRRLTDAKKIAGHGNWLPWLEREFGWTEMTAVRFMQVHELGETNNLLDLSLPVSGLYLLAAPSTPNEARDAIIEQAEQGNAISLEDVKRAIDEAREKDAANQERILAELRNEYEARECEIRSEYADKLVVDPAELQAKLDEAIAPLRRKIEQYEAKLQKIKEREQERIDKDREQRSKAAKKKAGAGIDSQASLDETAVRRALRDFVEAAKKITPQQMIKVARQSAKATEQSPKQWLGESPWEAQSAAAWLRKFMTLCRGV